MYSVYNIYKYGIQCSTCVLSINVRIRNSRTNTNKIFVYITSER